MSWYVRTIEDGIDEYDTAKEAKDAAEAELERARERSGDGWHEDICYLEWGELVTHAHVVQTKSEPAPDGSEFDEIADYGLVSVNEVSAEVTKLRAENERLQRALAWAYGISDQCDRIYHHMDRCADEEDGDESEYCLHCGLREALGKVHQDECIMAFAANGGEK